MRPVPEPSPINLPNILSVSRVLAAPVLVVLLMYPDRVISVVSAVMFTLVCITDWLDGYLARRMGVVTSLGKFLDPLADKILINTAFIMLIPIDRVAAWAVALIVGREVAVTGLRAIASDSGVVISASWLGKTKTVSQIVCLVPLLVHYRFFGFDFHLAGTLLLYVSLALTVWSGVDYFINFFRKKTLLRE